MTETGDTEVPAPTESLRIAVDESAGDVASGVQDAPHVDLGVALDVHDEVGKSRHWPTPEVGDLEFVGEAERAVVRMPADVGDGSFDGPDKPCRDVAAASVR